MLDKERLNQLAIKAREEQLEFSRLRKVAGMYYGDRRSIFMGSGVEMVKTREYQPGDEIQDIDFLLSAKEDKLIVVDRIEPRETRILIVLDLTKSMFLREKVETAFLASSMIINSAIVQNISTGIWCLAGRFQTSAPPASGKQQYVRLINLLQNTILSPKQVPRRPLTWEYWRQKELPAGSFIFVISDFLGETGFFRNFLNNNFREHDYKVVPVIIQDELEYTFPSMPLFGADVEFYDIGPGTAKVMHMSRKRAREIRANNEARFESIREMLVGKHFSFAHLSDCENVVKIHKKLQKPLL
jgi:hypothetical protein